MSEDRTYQIIEKLLTANLLEAEKARLRKELAAHPHGLKDYELLQKFWMDSEDQALSEFYPDSQKAWARVKNATINKDATSRTKIRSLKWMRYAAAAALALLIGFFMFFPEKKEVQWVSIETGPAQTQTVELPDGSIVTLNGYTELSWPKEFESRDVRLSGEAFFSVKRDETHPFRVLAGETETRVLGTEFNVLARPEENRIEVWVSEGSVAVALTREEENKQEVQLKPNQAAIWTAEDNRISKQENAQWNANAWFDKSLDFEDARINEVVRSLSRYFGKEIILEDPSLSKCRYTGSYQEPTLDEILQVLAFSLNIDYAINEDTIKLTGPGCE